MENYESYMQYDADKFLDVSRIVKLLNKHFKKGLSEEELVQLVAETYHYCATWYGKTKYPLPKLKIQKLGLSQRGGYNIQTNELTISIDDIQEIANEKDKSSTKILDLINSVAHEMRHFRQLVLADKYVELPDSAKDSLSEYSREIIKAFEDGYHERNKTAVAYLMDKYLGIEPETSEKHPDYRVYRMFVWNGLYLMNPQEKDARLGGAQLTNMIILQCLGDKRTSKETKDYIRANQGHLLNELQDSENAEYIELAKEFLETFDEKYMSASTDVILAMAHDYDKTQPEGVEGEALEDFVDKQKVYVCALGLLMKHKSVEERKQLYEQAKANNFRFLKNMTEQSLILDPEFIAGLGAGMGEWYLQNKKQVNACFFISF